MHRLGSFRRTTTGRARRRGVAVTVAGAAAVLAGITTLSACTSESRAPGAGPRQFSKAPGAVIPVANQSVGDDSSSAPAPMRVQVSPARGSERVNPAKPVDVTVANGTLLSVKVTNADGKHVTG